MNANKTNKTENPVNVTFTDEEKEGINIVANELSNEMFKEDLDAFVPNIINRLDNGSPVVKQMAERDSRQFTTELLKLVLKQEIQSGTGDITYMKSFIDIFNGGALDVGNAFQLITPLITGNGTYSPNNYLPAGVTKLSNESTVIAMENADGTLTTNAYRFWKKISLQAPLWTIYFKSGNLAQYILEQRVAMEEAYTLFMFDKIAENITNTTFKKSIIGTATDVFKCLTEEVYPEIARMQKFNSEFNISATSKKSSATAKDDLLMIISDVLLSKLATGVQSQLYNEKFIAIDSIINPDNIISLGNKIIIGGMEAVVAVDTSNKYVNNNELFVISKKAWLHLTQYHGNSEQLYGENMTIEVNVHGWGVYGQIPWKQGFKYTNHALDVMPSAATEPTALRSEKIRPINRVKKHINKK